MAAPRVVIVGGGVGGVSAAQQLAKANFANVTVIDRYGDHANDCTVASGPGGHQAVPTICCTQNSLVRPHHGVRRAYVC